METERIMNADGAGFVETTKHELRNSVEFAMDAKGKYKPTLKIYFSDEGFDTVAERSKRLLEWVEEQWKGRLVEPEPSKGAAKE